VGTAIRATAVSTDPTLRSSIAHASAAANECLRLAGVTAAQVDLLINVGVFRDSNMAEPAMSALIQKEVGMNLDFVQDPSPKAGFSFDLMNGACGALNAVQVAGAFLETGSAEYVLVVSGDAHPSTTGTPHPAGTDFPYATVGAAMLLERSWDAAAGFGRLHTASTGGSPGREGYIDLSVMEDRGRHQITVASDPGYVERLTDQLAASIREYATAEDLDLSRTLLVTSQPTPGFAEVLGRRVDAPAITVAGVDGDPHSSALILGYHQAVAAGLPARYDQVLFAAGGAGLSAVCSVYRPREELAVR